MLDWPTTRKPFKDTTNNGDLFNSDFLARPAGLLSSSLPAGCPALVHLYYILCCTCTERLSTSLSSIMKSLGTYLNKGINLLFLTMFEIYIISRLQARVDKPIGNQFHRSLTDQLVPQQLFGILDCKSTAGQRERSLERGADCSLTERTKLRYSSNKALWG